MARVVTFDNTNPLRELLLFAPGIDRVRSKLDGKRSTLTTVAKSTKSVEEGGEDEDHRQTGQQQKKQKKVKKTTGKKPTNVTSKKRKRAPKRKTAQERALLQQRASREGFAPMDSVAVFTGGRKLKEKSTV